MQSTTNTFNNPFKGLRKAQTPLELRYSGFMEHNIRQGVALTRIPPLLPLPGIDLRCNACNRVPIRRLLFQERLIPAQSCQDFGAQPDHQAR